MDASSTLTTSSDLSKPVQSLSPMKEKMETPQIEHVKPPSTNGEVSNGDSKVIEDNDVDAMDTTEKKGPPVEESNPVTPPPSVEDKLDRNNSEGSSPEKDSENVTGEDVPKNSTTNDLSKPEETEPEPQKADSKPENPEPEPEKSEPEPEPVEDEPVTTEEEKPDSEKDSANEPEPSDDSEPVVKPSTPKSKKLAKSPKSPARSDKEPEVDLKPAEEPEKPTPKSRGRKPKSEKTPGAPKPETPRDPTTPRIGRGEVLVGEDYTPDVTPLFDAPLQVSGKRERKTVDRLKAGPSEDDQNKEKVDRLEPSGSGETIGECEYVQYKISEADIELIRTLHHLLYGYKPKARVARQQVRHFNGFAFDKDSPKYSSKLKFLKKKAGFSEVQKMAGIFGIGVSGVHKDDLIEKLLAYLVKPTMVDKSVPKTPANKSATKRRRATSSKKGSEKKPRTSAKKSSNAKKASSSTAESPENADSESSGDESGSEESAAEEPSPPPKRAKTSSPSKPASPSKKGGSAKNPSDSELEKFIKDMLKDADLDTVTMKSVTSQVAAKYPSMDVAERKVFIKNTVRVAIAPK